MELSSNLTEIMNQLMSPECYPRFPPFSSLYITLVTKIRSKSKWKRSQKKEKKDQFAIINHHVSDLPHDLAP